MNSCWCGNDNLTEYSKDYYVCKTCGTLVTKYDITPQIYNVMDEENDLYGENYWTEKMMNLAGETSIKSLIQQYLSGRALYWLRYILKYIPVNSSVAEVGCGLGQLAYLMKFTGYQSRVYEISPNICGFLKNEMGLNVICGEFGSVNEIYEAVLCFDLLEHLIDPRAFIKESSSRLWGRSIFCCQTPCYTEEWSYEEMLEKSPSFEGLLTPEQHVYIFSKRSIVKLLREVGFNYIYFETPAFGEHYDMFLFASLKPFSKLDNEEIEKNLLKTEYGKIVEVLLDFFQRLNQ